MHCKSFLTRLRTQLISGLRNSIWMNQHDASGHILRSPTRSWTKPCSAMVWLYFSPLFLPPFQWYDFTFLHSFYHPFCQVSECKFFYVPRSSSHETKWLAVLKQDWKDIAECIPSHHKLFTCMDLKFYAIRGFMMAKDHSWWFTNFKWDTWVLFVHIKHKVLKFYTIYLISMLWKHGQVHKAEQLEPSLMHDWKPYEEPS